MRPYLRPHRASRRFLRDTRGATITEYALMLFLVVVVAATAFRFLGATIARGVSGAMAHFTTSHEAGKPTDVANVKANAAAAASAAAAQPAVANTQPGFGGPRAAEATREESSLGKFALLALGVVGCGAVFFVAMKGKNAGGDAGGGQA